MHTLPCMFHASKLAFGCFIVNSYLRGVHSPNVGLAGWLVYWPHNERLRGQFNRPQLQHEQGSEPSRWGRHLNRPCFLPPWRLFPRQTFFYTCIYKLARDGHRAIDQYRWRMWIWWPVKWSHSPRRYSAGRLSIYSAAMSPAYDIPEDTNMFIRGKRTGKKNKKRIWWII
jgi:hypothetical protein